MIHLSSFIQFFMHMLALPSRVFFELSQNSHKNTWMDSLWCMKFIGEMLQNVSFRVSQKNTNIQVCNNMNESIFGWTIQAIWILGYDSQNSLYSLFSGLSLSVSFPWLWSVTRVKYTPFLSSNWLCVPLSTACPCSKPTITSALWIVDRRCEMLIVVLPCRAWKCHWMSVCNNKKNGNIYRCGWYVVLGGC